MTQGLWPPNSQKPAEGVRAPSQMALGGGEQDYLSSEASAPKV